ncbi:MAG TPA: phosphate ABC transporter permease subunit PstC [Coriobacteriia bacterium]|nr:phosphate ABC transporter permease subunit PstC [Coriobacteriia bacterium]
MRQPPASQSKTRRGRPGISRTADAVVRRLIALSGLVAILILTGIFVFLALNSVQAFQEVGLIAMLKGADWYPTSDPASFGFLPSEVGSLWVTFVALLLCVPVGIGSAIYLSEFTPSGFKEFAKSMVELMAAVPSVVLGLLGLAFVVPWVRTALGLSSGLTAFSAGLVVGVLCLPTIISIAEDALHAVPESLRQGSLALGNTHWQTTYKVVVPAASSGIFAAVMLGLGRAIGETMVVLMLAGNSGLIIRDPFDAARTLTGTIAGEMAEVVRGGLHFSVLFAMALVLFAVTFVVNLAADWVLERQRRRWRR